MTDSDTGDVARYLRALLFLQAQTFLDEPKVKPELLLARAGLTATEIALCLGKNKGAVAKALQRAK